MTIKSTITTPPPAPGTTPPPLAAAVDAAGNDAGDKVRETAEIERALEHSLRVYGDLGHLKFELDLERNTDVCILSGPLMGVQGICFRRDGRAYIAFRGSNELQDWLLNAIFIPVGIPFFTPFRHIGFAAAWLRVRGQLRRWLKQTGAAHEPLSITGHSLGGAVATLAALDLARTFNVRDVITFGAPRSLFLGAAKVYEDRPAAGVEDRKLGEHTWTVVNFRDIVSKIPTWPFREVGELVFIDGAGSVHWGTKAELHRSTQRYSDVEFVFSDWPNTNPVPPVQPFGAPQSKGWNEAVEHGKIFATLIKTVYPAYIFFGLLVYQLVRSGMNHPLGLYGEVFLPDRYERIQTVSGLFKSRWQKTWELITSLVLLGLAAVAALYVVRWLFF